MSEPSLVRLGKAPPKPFFLSKGLEKWEPNANVDKLPTLQVKELPEAMVTAFTDGSARVRGDVVMWRAGQTEAHPFAVVGVVDSNPGMTLPSNAASIIGLDSAIVEFYWSAPEYQYSSPRGINDQLLTKGEALFFIGRSILNESKTLYKRTLIAKRIATLPCGPSIWISNSITPPMKCTLHKARARIVEGALGPESGNYKYRELDIGEIYIYESGEKSELYRKPHWWERYLDPLFNYLRND